MYYYGARYYNPRESVWLSVDPLAEKYPNISPYAYTFNNPIIYTDPTGMEGEEISKPNDWFKNPLTGEIRWFNTKKDAARYWGLQIYTNISNLGNNIMELPNLITTSDSKIVENMKKDQDAYVRSWSEGIVANQMGSTSIEERAVEYYFGVDEKEKYIDLTGRNIWNDYQGRPLEKAKFSDPFKRGRDVQNVAKATLQGLKSLVNKVAKGAGTTLLSPATLGDAGKGAAMGRVESKMKEMDTKYNSMIVEYFKLLDRGPQ